MQIGLIGQNSDQVWMQEVQSVKGVIPLLLHVLRPQIVPLAGLIIFFTLEYYYRRH